ncbi:MAG: MBL fold metallo-hydrolase, partial [Acidimicrobiia bacterium]
YGLVPIVRSISKAQAFMGAEDYARLTDSRLHLEIKRLLQQSGFPPEMLDQMGERMRNVERVHKVAAVECTPIKEGDVFQFSDFELKAIALPGHTGGHLGYLEEESGTLFAGDTLLPHISPNPLLEPEGEPPSRRRPSLKQYLDSLDYLESMDLRMVYPGHGPPITNAKANIRYMREHHHRRLDVIAGSLGSRGPRGTTAYEVSRRLYPDAQEYNYFLALSEVVAHLDVLVQLGRAKQEVRDGVEFFVEA